MGNKLSRFVVFLLVMLLLAITVNADTEVDENTVIITLDGDFNYTFAGAMNFTEIAWYSDRVELNQTNITIIPHSGTGNATIRNVSTTLINFSICGEHQNMNMSLQNMSTYRVLTITNTTQTIQTIANDENVTINATDDCIWISIEPDFTIPTLTINEPSPSTTTYLTTDRIDFNVTVTDLYPDTCILDWNGANYTMTRTGSECTKTLGNIADGVYSYYVWANDTTGNANVTDTANLTMEFEAYWYLTHSGSVDEGGGGGQVIITPPTQPPIVNVTDNVSDEIIPPTDPPIKYVIEEYTYLDPYVSFGLDIYDLLDDYARKDVYEFPKCIGWSDNQTTELGDPICDEYLPMKGYQVLIVVTLMLLLVGRWLIVSSTESTTQKK